MANQQQPQAYPHSMYGHLQAKDCIVCGPIVIVTIFVACLGCQFSPHSPKAPKNHRWKNRALTTPWVFPFGSARVMFHFTTSAARLRAIAAGYRDLERKFSRAHRLALKDGHLIVLNITTSCNKFRHIYNHLHILYIYIHTSHES